MYLEVIDQKGSPLPPYYEFETLYEMLTELQEEIIPLYRYVYDPEGEGHMCDEYLHEIYSHEEAACLKQMAIEDFHPISELCRDVERFLLELNQNANLGQSDLSLIDELNQLLELCQHESNQAIAVQIRVVDEDH